MEMSSERLPNMRRVMKDALIVSLLSTGGNAMETSLSCLHYEKHWSQRRDRSDLVFVSWTLNTEWQTADCTAKVEVTRTLMTCLAGSLCIVKHHVPALFQLLRKKKKKRNALLLCCGMHGSLWATCASWALCNLKFHLNSTVNNHGYFTGDSDIVWGWP